MELGVYVPVRVWVGRSSGSYDAHSFPPSYPPQPARLAGGCTAPGLLAGDRTGPGDSGGTLAFTTLHGDAYALSGPRYPALVPTAPGIPDADYRGRLPRGAGTESPPSPRRSCGWNPWRWGGFAKANSAVSPQRRGVPVRSPGRELAGYANAVQLGRLPRPFRGSRRYRNNSRQIREIRFCSAGVRSGFTAAAVRRSS